MENVERLLAQGLASLSLHDVALDEKSAQLMQLHALLIKWAAVINLTAIHDPVSIITRHFMDSLVVLPYLKAGRVLDLGTGAGFPGLPLAIFSPDRSFILLDGNQKKTAFIRQAVMALGLKNVQIVAKHSTAYVPSELFDTVIARAVGSLELLQKAAQPLLSSGGELLCMKAGVDVSGAKSVHGFSFDKVIPLQVFALPEARCLVRFVR